MFVNLSHLPGEDMLEFDLSLEIIYFFKKPHIQQKWAYVLTKLLYVFVCLEFLAPCTGREIWNTYSQYYGSLQTQFTIFQGSFKWQPSVIFS